MRYLANDSILKKQVKYIRYGYVTLFLVMLFFPFVANAQEGNRVEYKTLGFRFTVPPFWDQKETEGLYLLTNQNERGFVMISSWRYADIDVLKAQFEDGVKKENGFFLAPAEAIELINTKRLQGKFSGLINYSPVIAYLVLIQGEQQQTVIIVSAIAKEKYSEKQKITAIEIAESFMFFNPVMPSLIDEYIDLLTNTRLIFTSGSSETDFDKDEFFDNNNSFGYQEKTIIDLCEQGFFTYSSFKAGNGSAAFAAGNKPLNGQWQIVKNKKGIAVLRLGFDDGDTIEYDIEYLEGKVYLNGDQYIRSTPSASDSYQNQNKPYCN